MNWILIVDDDSNIRDGIIQILQDNLSFDFDVQQAANGLEGLEKIVEYHPAIVISDIKMKEHDGVWMLSILEKCKISCNTIILSGYDDYTLIRNSMKFGAVDYLLKPLNTRVFIDLVQEIWFKRLPANYDTSLLEKYLKEKQYTNIKNSCIFFDLPCLNPLNRDMLKAILSDATVAVSSGQINEALSLFSGFFDGCSQDVLSEAEIRNMLTAWIYDLMQKNNMYIKIISQYKLTAYDLANTLKMLPTLSQIKLRFCENLKIHMQDYCKELSENDEYIIQMAKDYIEKNYANNITLQDVSEQLYIHPNYFSSLFSSKTNTTFRDYLCSVRIENAKRLMQQPNMRIVDIACSVGYNDISHFNRAFKRITSMTPSQYRRQQKLLHS